MFKSIIITLLFLISMLNGQQICMKESCATHIAACNLDCIKLMGKCYFECTLMSQGCMQDCVTGNKPARELLDCSYNKCLNL